MNFLSFINNIDFGLVLNGLTAGIVISYLNSSKYKRYKLNKKNHKITLSKIKEKNEFFKQNNVKMINVRKQYEEEIKEFIIKIEEELPHVDKTNLYNNIKDLIIYEIEKVNNNSGFYVTPYNTIALYPNDENKKLVFKHELFHLASSKINGKIYFSGFRLYNEEKDIGKGINEGYTECLLNKYFNKNEFRKYQMLDAYMKFLEEIIGKKEMENFYFKADLNKLIEEMKKYQSEESVLKFIKDMDALWYLKYHYQLKVEDKETLDKILSDISNFLFEMKLSKETQKNSVLSNAEINKIIMELYFTYDVKAENGRISGDNFNHDDVIKLVNRYNGNLINKAK